MKKRNARINRTRRLTLCAMLVALAVALLYLGSLFDVLTLSVVVLASLPALFAVRELRTPLALVVYAATGLLSLLLLPNKEGAVLYLLFGGLYPILKFPTEHLPRPLPLLLKLLLFNLAITLAELGTVLLFGLPPLPVYYYLFLYLVGNPVFFVYDRLLDRLLILYEAKWRPRIAAWLPDPNA